jgi:ubiquinone/menaquinone biosynthesis C-methylase UbiE
MRSTCTRFSVKRSLCSFSPPLFFTLPPYRKPAHGRPFLPGQDRPQDRPAGRGPERPRPGPPRGPAPQGKDPSRDQGWDPVAGWYDKLVGDGGSDYHQQLILPATLRLLAVQPRERVLDLCCGQGVFLRQLAYIRSAQLVGVDASPRLIEAARQRTQGHQTKYLIADVCTQNQWADGQFDAAACLMAVHDVPHIEPLFANLAQALKPGGRAVVVMMHPCFRIPRQSHWGWDEDKKIQYRRLDRYSVPLEIPISTHPGRDVGQQTTFYHRPLSAYLNAIGSAGLGVVACEELHSHRRSQPGSRSRGEHRAAEEFPLFMVLKLLKPAAPAAVATDPQVGP